MLTDDSNQTKRVLFLRTNNNPTRAAIHIYKVVCMGSDNMEKDWGNLE